MEGLLNKKKEKGGPMASFLFGVGWAIPLPHPT